MTIITKKWPVFCDYVIVLEYVHTYISFVFYEVQKHLDTQFWYFNVIQYPISGLPLDQATPN